MPLVVVIEDDAGSRKTLGRVLGAGGFDAALYESAEAFLEAPPDRPPIGMLLDLQLGGMSGLDLLRSLTGHDPHFPTIIITAFESRQYREEARRLGCVAYLKKPCEAKTILAALRNLTGGIPD